MYRTNRHRSLNNYNEKKIDVKRKKENKLAKKKDRQFEKSKANYFGCSSETQKSLSNNASNLAWLNSYRRPGPTKDDPNALPRLLTLSYADGPIVSR